MTVVPSGYAFKLAYSQDEETYGVQYTTGDGNTNPGEQEGDATTAAFKASTGLWRDISHGSYYGCYLTDAVWYEVLTGKRAPITSAGGSAVVSAPDTIDADEHLERLEYLSRWHTAPLQHINKK